MFSRFSLHQITDPNSPGFDSSEYSRFKFGDNEIARKFGLQLAQAYAKTFENEIREEAEIVLVPSPFHAIPTASYHMTAHFAAALDLIRYGHGKKALSCAKISRNMTYAEDYGEMSFEERVRLISSTTYAFDPAQFDGKKVILTDDIRITGSHELVIRRLLESSGVKGAYRFVYFAELMNASVSPTYENILNYFEIKTLSDLISLFNSPTFVFNTRVVKFILKSDEDHFLKLVENSSSEKLQELVRLAIGNNYHLMQAYKQNLQHLINRINYGH